VLVNAICPGWVATDLWVRNTEGMKQEFNVKTEEEARKVAAKKNSLSRMGKPEELANATVFLCSERASYITGVSLNMDGGRLKGLWQATACRNLAGRGAKAGCGAKGTWNEHSHLSLVRPRPHADARAETFLTPHMLGEFVTTISFDEAHGDAPRCKDGHSETTGFEAGVFPPRPRPARLPCRALVDQGAQRPHRAHHPDCPGHLRDGCRAGGA
jgi:hypothetical protein